MTMQNRTGIGNEPISAEGGSEYNLVRKSEDDFEKLKNETKELHLYAYSTLYQMSKFSSDNWGYALYDADGYLTRLFGNAAFFEKCKERDIIEGTFWDVSNLGNNAVGLGLTQNELIQTLPHQHASKNLSDVTITFSPISCSFNKVRVDHRNVKIIKAKKDLEAAPEEYAAVLGGIAILSFERCDTEHFLPLVEASAREISTQLMWFNRLYRDLADDTGRLSLDQSRGINQIMMLTANIYEYFGLNPKRSYRLNRLESIIDGLPRNEEFWSIVNSRKNVKDYQLELSVNNTIHEMTISTILAVEKRILMKEFIINIHFKQGLKASHKQDIQAARLSFDKIICHSPLYSSVVEYAKTVANSRANILLLGESGVGKDVFAQAIHEASDRRKQPFVAVNCAVFTKQLIASELFGYEAGAFTGASKTGAMGKFELANRGTLFLDEIGDLPLEMQAHLLRAIETKRFMKVGGTKEIHSDVHIISATNSDLARKVQEKLFREDLFYRLNVITINIPPLRKRKEDIIPLTEFFIQKISSRFSKPEPILMPDAKSFLVNHYWHGNVRELENLIEAIISVSPETLSLIDSALILKFIENNEFIKTKTSNPKSDHNRTADASEIIAALKAAGNNVGEAAKLMGVSRRTFYRRLEQFDLLK